MLGCNVSGYTRSCTTIVGGCDLLLVGDANDWDLTEGAADTNGDPTGYSILARRTGATAVGGALLFPIDSLEDSIDVQITQANAEGASSAWEYVIAARMAKMSQIMTNFNKKMDAASVCCQLIFFWEHNDGTLFVAGEKYVGGVRIPKFRFRQDGSKMGSGKKFSEFNGQDLSMKGSYLRPPYEFTGGIAALEAFMPS